MERKEFVLISRARACIGCEYRLGSNEGKQMVNNSGFLLGHELLNVTSVGEFELLADWALKIFPKVDGGLVLQIAVEGNAVSVGGGNAGGSCADARGSIAQYGEDHSDGNHEDDHSNHDIASYLVSAGLLGHYLSLFLINIGVLMKTKRVEE